MSKKDYCEMTMGVPVTVTVVLCTLKVLGAIPTVSWVACLSPLWVPLLIAAVAGLIILAIWR